MDVDEAVAILRAASPHGWVESGTCQPEPAPLRGTVSLATPAREPRANEAGAVVLAAVAQVAAERDAARLEVERHKEALLAFIHAYANTERLDRDHTEIKLFEAWIKGCGALGIKAQRRPGETPT
jgi:hypothetical protein